MFIALQGVLPFMPLLPVVLVIGLWGHVDTRFLLAWLAAAISVSVMRFYVVRAYLADASQSSARVWANRVAATSLWDGLIWGFAGAVFFVPESVAHQVLIVTMVVGIPAGSVFVTSYWPPVQYGFAVPAVGMTALKLISAGSAASVGLGVGMIAYIVILTRIMRRARAIALEATLLRFENLDLVEQLQEQKTAAENANVAKSQFLAAASHDLRQPLHALALYTDALSDRITSGKDLEIVFSIQRCVSALEDLFQSLLDISRLDAGIVEPKIDHFELRPLVERLAGDYAAQAARNGVTFSAECPALVVESDASLLERILLNLLSNAVRYTDSGSIRIAAHKENGNIRISVIDTGPGIPAARHEDIFREFVQLQNPGRDRSKGLGLGLAIVRRLADLLGLQLDVHSEPGKGSTFSLVVRAGDAAKLPQAEGVASSVPRNQLQGKLLVVVEDEADVREGMRVLLEGWGCKVIASDDGDKALQRACVLRRTTGCHHRRLSSRRERHRRPDHRQRAGTFWRTCSGRHHHGGFGAGAPAGSAGQWLPVVAQTDAARPPARAC